MKKRSSKKKTIILVAILLLVILLLPIPATYDDGGTREWTALTYKIVRWVYLDWEYNEDGSRDHLSIYNKTVIYFFPNSLKSINELWVMEEKDFDISEWAKVN